MNSPVQIIKERLSIVDVISSYINVEKSGKNYKAKCPFHNEKTPSFFISPDRNSYYCFGCGAKGDIFSFVENFEGLDFMGSLKLLAERAGVPLVFENNFKDKNEFDKYFQIMEDATIFFENNLLKNKDALAYLKNRGLKDETIKNFRIGFALDSWRSLFDYLIAKKYKKEDIEKVGLIKISNGSNYDRFRSRIMFPICDSGGRVIAFSGRIFGLPKQSGKDEQEPAKYINSPDTPLFNKSNVLFGIDKAKQSIRSRNYSIIVEGQFDLIMSHQAGFTNTVAVSGTAFSENIIDNESKINNLGLIRRLSQNVIFAYDGDSAGIRAASRSAMIAFSLDMQVKIAILDEGKDPADIILDNSKKWNDIIKDSVNIIEFHVKRICKNTNDIRKRGVLIREIIFPFLLMINSSIERSAYISMIHNQTGITEKSIIEDFEKYEKSKEIVNVKDFEIKDKKIINEKRRRDNLENKLFGIIFWQGDNSELISIDYIKEKIGNDKFTIMYENYKPFSSNLAFEAEMWYGDKTDKLKGDIDELILNLEEEILNDELILLLEKINQKEKNNEEIDINLLVEYQNIKRRIEGIKSKRF